MRKKGGIISQEAIEGLEKKVIKTDTKRVDEELSKVREVPLSCIVIETGARDYGPPADATERRM